MKLMKMIFLFFVFCLATLVATNFVWAGYVDNFDGTVTDQSTGIVWQKQQLNTGGISWEQALAVCNEVCASHDGWRLPNKRELESLVNRSLAYPSIDPIFMLLGTGYWSSTTVTDSTDYAFMVEFAHGTTDYVNKDSNGLALCVRGGPLN